jgi:hypothetical protein
MHARQTALYESFRRVLRCIERHDVLRERAGELRAYHDLRQTVSRLADLETEQGHARLTGKELTAVERKARTELRHILFTAANIAAHLETAASDARNLPAPNSRASTRDVITAARVAAKAARRLEAQLVGYGMQRTFLADMVAAANALEKLLDDRAAARGDLTRATVAVGNAITHGRNQVTRLEAVLSMLMSPEVEAEWQQCRRLGRRHRPPPKRVRAGAVLELTPLLQLTRASS